MGTFIGHVAPGAGFLLIGLWHLFNTLLNYLHNPWNFETRAWFPVKLCSGKLRHAELYAIIAGSLLSIAAELFIGPARHEPLADDLTVPSEHLNNFEHSTISLFFFMYALVARLADTGQLDTGARSGSAIANMLPFGLVHMMGALAWAQELLLFHLHSTDHMGLEGHYHWLLQLIVWVSLGTTLLEIPCPHSFLLTLVRSLSIVYQGVWFIQMGFVLWMPSFTPKGCALQHEPPHRVVRCDNERSTMRAKALATLQFSWDLAALVAVALLAIFLAAGRHSGQPPRYETVEAAVAHQNLEHQLELSMHAFKSRSLSGSDHGSSSMDGFPGAVHLGG